MKTTSVNQEVTKKRTHIQMSIKETLQKVEEKEKEKRKNEKNEKRKIKKLKT